MDNHKWAFVVWNENTKRNMQYLLVHVDYHWDAGYDYWYYPEYEKIFLSSDNNEIIKIVSEEKFIRFDSFICPAIAKNIVDEVHFLCFQGDEDGDVAIFKDFLDKYNCDQTLHNSIISLSEVKSQKPILFDFCIDVFNRSNMWYGSDIWPVEEIDVFLSGCEPLVKSAEIVTISMSYGYSGSEEDTKRLAQKVLNCFYNWRDNSE